MKVLDPQAALLTTAEVHQFLASNKPRPADKKIGAYGSVNLHNHAAIRQDLETYITVSTPYVLEQPQSELWMKELIVRLRKYKLTKTEVFSLINLGIGINRPSVLDADAEGESAQVEVNGQAVPATTNEKEDEDEAEPEQEQTDENSLDRMLFGLVVEEVDERFAGDEGEQQIGEILKILKETIGQRNADTNGKVVNGN